MSAPTNLDSRVTNSKITRAYEREAEPWPLTTSITKKICLHAGREASAALRIALAYDKNARSRASAAHEAVFYEPFTYWDWHGVGADDTDARDRKRQRFWEHQRGFMVNGTTPFGYPTSRGRWRSFQKQVEQNSLSRKWVKKIALANWMETDDFSWYVSLRP